MPTAQRQPPARNPGRLPTAATAGQNQYTPGMYGTGPFAAAQTPQAAPWQALSPDQIARNAAEGIVEGPVSALGQSAPPNLTGAPGHAGQGAYGLVPTAPNPIATQGTAISGNMGNLGSLYGLGVGVAGAGAAAAQQPFLQNLPGYASMVGQASQNIGNDLRGQVSPDVVNMLGQQAAERGVGFGAGAPNSNTALLRSLGLTSMGLQAQGQGELTQAIGRTPVGAGFNANNFLVSPGDMQSAQNYANTLAAAPDPTQAADAALAAARQGFNQGRTSGPNAPGGPTGGGGGPVGPTTTGGTGTGGGGAPGGPRTGGGSPYPPGQQGQGPMAPGGGGGGFNWAGTPWGGGGSPWGQEDWSGGPPAGSVGMFTGGGTGDQFGLFGGGGGSIGDQLGQDMWNQAGGGGSFGEADPTGFLDQYYGDSGGGGGAPDFSDPNDPYNLGYSDFP